MTNIVRLAGGRYRAKVTKCPLTGKPLVPIKALEAKTARRAAQKRADWLKNYKPLKPVLNRKLTVAVYISDTYLPMLERLAESGKRAPAYVSGVIGRFNNFFLDCRHRKYPKLERRIASVALCSVTIGDFAPKHIREFFSTLADCEVPDGLRYAIKQDWCTMFKRMGAAELLPYSPGDYWTFQADPDTAIPTPSFEERVTFNEDEVARALSNPVAPLYPKLVVAAELTLQCRPSELWALLWDDIDTEKCRVRVSKAKRVAFRGGFEIGSTKTKRKDARWNQPLHIPKELATLFAQVRDERERAGINSPFVFLTIGKNRPMTNNNFNMNNERGQWWKIKTALGLPHGPKFYSLKHLGTSALLEFLSETRVAKRLGHASTKTLKHYAVKPTLAENQAIDRTFERFYRSAGSDT